MQTKKKPAKRKFTITLALPEGVTTKAVQEFLRKAVQDAQAALPAGDPLAALDAVNVTVAVVALPKA